MARASGRIKEGSLSVKQPDLVPSLQEAAKNQTKQKKTKPPPNATSTPKMQMVILLVLQHNVKQQQQLCDLVVRGLGSEGLGEHNLAHPLNPIVRVVDGKVVSLSGAAHQGALDAGGRNGLGSGGSGDELEGERSNGGGSGLGRRRVGGEPEALELVGQLVGSACGTGDGVVVNVETINGGARGKSVVVKGKSAVLEPHVAILPLVTEELGLSLLDPAQVTNTGVRFLRIGGADESRGGIDSSLGDNGGGLSRGGRGGAVIVLTLGG